MSKKDNVTEQNEQKVMTKYDLKMQKRQEAKAKEAKQNRIEKIVGVVVLAALVCFIAYFPISSFMAVKETFVKVKGQDISRVEFDYNYNVVKNNYLNTYGSYLSAFGMDLSGDLSTQMFSETLTWEDYFEKEAMGSIIRGKALLAEAEKAGFTYDVEGDYATYKENIIAQAKEAGYSTKDYVKLAYGSYATMSRIEDYVKESLYVNAFYNEKEKELTPSDEEIQAHYEADKASYDSVDYYLTVIEAEIPIEPTELADPVDETADAAAEETESGEEEAYQPSDAEIEKAMADAKVLADEALEVVASEGEFNENMKYSNVPALCREWLFDENRQAGDSTIVEFTASNAYYVLYFVNRYLDETATVDARIITTTEDGQQILDEWKNGEATEDSFAALADIYNDSSDNGGLYEAIATGGTEENIAVWLFDAARVAGDTTAITTSDGNTYVMYFVGQNELEWKLNIQSEMLAETMEFYLQEISADYDIDDAKGNLEYIAIEAADAEDAVNTEDAADTEETVTEETTAE